MTTVFHFNKQNDLDSKLLNIYNELVFWNEESLQATLRQLRRFGGDTTLIECKRAGSGAHEDTYESIAAFANMPEGGTILLGVDERLDFQITGVENQASLQRQIAQKTRNAIQPAPSLDFTPIYVGQLCVLAVEVAALAPTQKPAKYKNKYYLRQADGDYEMNANDLHMLKLAGLHAREIEQYDAEILDGTDVAELDQDLLKTYVSLTRNSSHRLRDIDEDRLLQLTHVTDREGQLRLGGLYSLGFYPQSVFPSLAVTAAVRLSREVGSTARTRNLKDFSGPIPALLNDVMAWVKENLSEDRTYGPDGHMATVPELPMNAVRELVANALVHRDLSANTVDLGKRVEIRIDSHRLTIKSPGGLKGLTREQIIGRDLTKVAVNQRVYEQVKNLRTEDDMPIIEGEGGGIQEVFHAMRVAGKPDPLFFDNGVEFTAQLLRAPRYSEEELDWLNSFIMPLSWIQKELLIGLLRGQVWTMRRAIQEFSPASEREVRAHVAALRDGKIIEEDVRDHALVLREEVSMAVYPRSEAKVQSTGPSDKEISSLGPNTLVVFNALREGLSTVADIENSVGLTSSKVRYALKQLKDAKYVGIRGGRGNQHSRYFIL